MNELIVKGYILALKSFENKEIVALYTSLSGFKKVHNTVYGYSKAIEAEMLDDQGLPKALAETLSALNHELKIRNI